MLVQIVEHGAERIPLKETNRQASSVRSKSEHIEVGIRIDLPNRKPLRKSLHNRVYDAIGITFAAFVVFIVATSCLRIQEIGHDVDGLIVLVSPVHYCRIADPHMVLAI